MKNIKSLKGKKSYKSLQKIGLWTKRIDANRPDNNSRTYQIVSLARFLHRLRLSAENRNLPESQLFCKTETEQVLRLILRLSFLIRFRVFREYTHAFS